MDYYHLTNPSGETIDSAHQCVETTVNETSGSDEVIATVASTIGTPISIDARSVLATIFSIRKAVFVDEQGVDPEDEWDKNEPTATHLLGVVDDRPVGTARVRFVDSKTAKIERVAVRKPDRGSGYGSRLMRAIELLAVENGSTQSIVHAQRRVEGFYHTIGYETVSDVFEEAGIPHVEMRHDL